MAHILLCLLVMFSVVTCGADDATRDISSIPKSTISMSGNSLVLRGRPTASKEFNMDQIQLAYTTMENFLAEIRPMGPVVAGKSEPRPMVCGEGARWEQADGTFSSPEKLCLFTEELRRFLLLMKRYDEEISYTMECSLVRQLLKVNRARKHLRVYEYDVCQVSPGYEWIHSRWIKEVAGLRSVFDEIPHNDRWYLRQKFDHLLQTLEDVHRSVESEIAVCGQIEVTYSVTWGEWMGGGGFTQIFFSLFLFIFSLLSLSLYYNKR